MPLDRLEMQDPREQYAKPPFKAQQQSQPGLQAVMEPRPDCGEQSYKGSGKLKGRRALVTGGDSGIGRAAIIAFAREGADIAFNYLAEEEKDAQEVVALIKKEGRKAFAIPGDITEEKFCLSLVEKAASDLGGIDILVNNAAAQSSAGSLMEITTEQFDRTLKTNLYALLWITKAAVPHLKPGSSIINTTSVQAYHPSETLVDYALTKAGIADFTKSIAKELIKKGIRVNGIAPGPFWTPIQPSGNGKKLEKLGANVPMGRPGQPVELAPLYVLLASQEGSYIVGEIFGATGGIGIA
jgi:NAD(P)-dependent dehydrogenase (short-subunit alcohol dehydrogenase family)